ncbi:hypothetical protein [Promicromonospora soli]|uniref:Uncharacterized protein n=1 Tax=Promicromonospora soli TaxID=2035533 RepID=A0A919KTC4_9MICO|nr:hypothetical protein [Promicromonospora soli]GHH71829.1 hypothetical protein GCM10017772_20380 [Promicromonospora soli]
MTKQLNMAPGGMRIVLPGSWTRIPLEDPEQTVAFVKRFVKRQTGKADRLAKVRRETVQDLLASARDAAQVGVHTYLMSLEILPRVPFPAALLFLDQSWTEASRSALAEGDVEGALTATFGDVEMGDSRNGPFGRRWEVLTQTLGEEELLTLRLEYFVPYPDGSRVLLARANVPNIPQAEPFGLLFNEIMDSITFPDPDEPEDVPTETAGAAAERPAAVTATA